MKKKLLIALSVVVLLVAAAGAWFVLVANKRSPKDTVSHKDVSITYCRPYKRDRVIFGGDGALVPNGHYWRLGANAATEITFAKDTTLAGKPVKAGTYVIYAVPGDTMWKIALNSDNGRWGAREVDHAKDVLTVEVPPEHTSTPLEQFTITIDDDKVNFAWDTTVVHLAVGAPAGA